jgi:hypothetical protein
VCIVCVPRKASNLPKLLGKCQCRLAMVVSQGQPG